MTSASMTQAITAEPRPRHSTGKRAGAIVYGLCLTGGLLLMLRAEFVEKFGMPLLFSTRGTLEFSTDDGASWQAAARSEAPAEVFSVTPPAGHTEAVALRGRDPKTPLISGLEEANIALIYSVDGGKTWARAERAKAAGIDCLAIPAGAGAATVRIVPAGTIGTAAELAAAADEYASATVGLPRRVAVAWLLACLPVVPMGISLAWVVLRLGYLKDGATVATLVFFTLFGLTMIVPFLWMISTAFKTSEATDVFRVQWIAWPIRCENFSDVFSRIDFARFYFNTIFLSCYVTLGLVFTSSLAAYSFARLEFPGRDKIFMAYLATMMIPGAVTTIPVFVLMCKIGWVDSYKAIIVPGIVGAYGTFMLRQFFMTLPRDLEDAAKIDGCSLFGIFTRIIVPLSKPAIATLTILTFMGSWNDFMWPLIILNSPEKMPLSVGIQFFRSAEVPDPNVLMCASMLMIVPVIIVFLMGQRYFVEGIQLGAIKG